MLLMLLLLLLLCANGMIRSQFCTSRQPSCRDMCKVVTLLDRYFSRQGNACCQKIWTISSYIVCEMGRSNIKGQFSRIMKCKNGGQRYVHEMPNSGTLISRPLLFNHISLFIRIRCRWRLVPIQTVRKSSLQILHTNSINMVPNRV